MSKIIGIPIGYLIGHLTAQKIKNKLIIGTLLAVSIYVLLTLRGE